MPASSSAPSRPITHSFVLEHPAAPPTDAQRHFAAKLAFETDPADLRLDLERGTTQLIVVDTRSPEAYRACHIPGAISLPGRTISAATTARFSNDATFVAYCWGPGCNGSTRAALKLSALGFRVKELIGGIEYWRHEGLPVEGTLGADAPLYG